jgi:hypothetical protein
MGEREAGPWVLDREIGSGSFAKVWRATHKQTQQVAAVKEINLDKLSKKLQESLASEVAVLKHTQHHNIVCLVDLIKVGVNASRRCLLHTHLQHWQLPCSTVHAAQPRYFLEVTGLCWIQQAGQADTAACQEQCCTRPNKRL